MRKDQYLFHIYLQKYLLFKNKLNENYYQGFPALERKAKMLCKHYKRKMRKLLTK